MYFRRNSNESSNFDLVCGLAAARVMDLHLAVIWARWRSWVFATTVHFASTPPVNHQGEETPTAVCLPSKLAPNPFPLMRDTETNCLISTLLDIFGCVKDTQFVNAFWTGVSPARLTLADGTASRLCGHLAVDQRNLICVQTLCMVDSAIFTAPVEKNVSVSLMRMSFSFFLNNLVRTVLHVVNPVL